MKVKKRVLCARRVRQVPPQFSWIDQRLVRQRRHLQGCSAQALALYLVLVTVCDAEGLSYYSDGTVQKLLGMSGEELELARAQLGRAELIVYEHPLYQVLSLDEPPAGSTAQTRASQSLSAGEILRQIMGGGQ